MGKQDPIPMALQFTLAVVLLAATTAAQQFPISKPGCEGRCGNMTVPFPFGLTPECSLDISFFINCSKTSDPPLATLVTAQAIQVTCITLDGKARVMENIRQDCYNKSGRIPNKNHFSGYLGRFTVSDSDNKLVGIGCDTQVVARGFIKDLSEGTYELGCMSRCFYNYSVATACPGVGCCETPLPKGVSEYSISLTSFNNHSTILDFNPCSYAFIMEKEKFNYSLCDLKDLPYVGKVPMIAEWTVGVDNCTTVQKNQSMNLCKGNSRCYDPDINSRGYRCECLDGYEGNPYLPNGCQDIDECKNSTLNNCERICINTPGNYTCLCPNGYHGDGRRYGRGCIAGRSSLLLIIIGCSTGLGIPLLVAMVWWLYKVNKRRKEMKLKQEFFETNGGLLFEQQVSSGDGQVETTKLFTSSELERATNNYSENLILGRGGQGTVYKGMLEDGRIAAIKRSKAVDQSQLEQFINEVVILSKINHRNVVNLLGCCLETEVPMLVYEFIPNGMLLHHLQGSSHEQTEDYLPMTWEMRLRIALEVAEALYYLHSAASRPIYHRDIKSANILLDEKYRAKIADFGISRSIAVDQTHMTMTNVQGTFGYLDPEYFRTSQFTDKSDVYSFGVVIVELLTSEKPVSSARAENERSLANYFLLAMEENRLFEILDSEVAKEGPEEAIMAIAKLARRCLNMSGKKRPAMREVAAELEGIRVGLSTAAEGGLGNNQDGEGNDVVEYENTGSWECTSSSTTSYLYSTGSLSIDVEPLLFTS